MKKLIAIMLVLCMALSLAACAAPAAPAALEAPEAEGTEEAAAPAEPEAELTDTQKIIKEAEGMTPGRTGQEGNRRIQRRYLLRRWQLQPRQVCTASVH